MTQIRVGEIDLEDTQFQVRVKDFGENKVAFNELVESIQKNDIQHNIVVRRISGREQYNYQLISGFRRLTAFIQVCANQGKGDNYQDEKVWAKVYKETLSDEEAYQIAITENRQREQLSDWELLNFCRSVQDKMVADSPETHMDIINAQIGRMINGKNWDIHNFEALESQSILPDYELGSISKSN